MTTLIFAVMAALWFISTVNQTMRAERLEARLKALETSTSIDPTAVRAILERARAGGDA